MNQKMLASLTLLIKKNGAGLVALALIFTMVYSWFPKVEKTVEKINVTMIDITREFKQELKDQRIEFKNEMAEQRKDNRELIERLIEKSEGAE